MKGGGLAARGAGPSWACAACAVCAAGLALAHVAHVPDGGHDAAVARAMGLEAQPWGALDAVVASALAWMPVGTLAARAGMGQAAVLGLAAAAVYEIARKLLASCAQVPRIGAVVAAVGTWCAVLGPGWQIEGAVAGGTVLGAGLMMAAVLAVGAGADPGAGAGAGAGADADADAGPWSLAAFLLALTMGQDPLAGIVAAAACAALVGVDASARERLVGAWRTQWRTIVAWMLAGLLPLVFAFARTRVSGASLVDALWAWPGAERGVSATGAPWGLLQRELGIVLVALAVVGAVLSLLVGRARPLAAAMVTMATLGAASGYAGEGLGPSRYGAPVLAAIAAMGVLAGVSMQALVRAIAEARVPLAKASAAMVLVLELVAPVDTADEALHRASALAHGGGALPEPPAPAWDDAAWGVLPPRSIVLVTDARVWRRASAARALGALRGDVAVVPTFAHGRMAAPFLARDVTLVPLWRDLALVGAPSEESLSSLAATRPVVTSFDPAWGKALGKHLVPAGLFDRFEPEPRGVSDRRKVLEAFVPSRERLARAVVRDPDLAAAAAVLLRQRVLDLASSGDRELVGGAVADLDAFAPGDPLGAEVVAKLVARPRP